MKISKYYANHSVGKAGAMALALGAFAPIAHGQATQAESSQPAKPSTATDDQGSQLQEVVVTGIRASLERAMDIKRDADTVVDSISAEDIGKFPDANVSESLQRITGVAIDRNQLGEGQTVTIRGFGPNFNTVLVDGRQLPTQTGHRSFDFDTLPADLISGADVYKTSMADQDDGGIGGLMNLHTSRPLDLKKLAQPSRASRVRKATSSQFTCRAARLRAVERHVRGRHIRRARLTFGGGAQCAHQQYQYGKLGHRQPEHGRLPAAFQRACYWLHATAARRRVSD